MDNLLKDIRVAILVADGFEEDEMIGPRNALEEAGAETTLISPSKRVVKSWKSKEWSDEYPVDLDILEASADDFDALVLPGGVINPDLLRTNPDAINFIKDFVDADKPIGAICHGPWTLINAGGVNGKTMTSWSSIKLDLTNAGANWVDKEVVQDGQLVTSRKPADIPAFNQAIIKLFQKVKV